LVRYGELTADRRPPPDFLIIGTKRGGTTSLWHYLVQHPLVFRLFPAWNGKSPHYFEENWHRGESWYRSHFPTRRQRREREQRYGGRSVAGEASPLYMFHPLVAGRVREALPDVRLIVLLRDPVERAYSHWKERRTQRTEPLDFAAALAAEPARIAGERDRMLAEPGYFSHAWDWYTYRTRGRYLEQLEPWLSGLPGQLLVLASESLYREPAAVYRTVLDFLGLPPFQPVRFEVHNDRPSAPMDPAVREELTDYYRPHNLALAARLGMDFDWAAA
jgi:sulfotransferase family protein